MSHTPPRRVASRIALLAIVFFVAMLTGCAGYQLRGKVIDGPTPAVLVVPDNDPRLKNNGLMGATVRVTVDPQQMRPKQLTPAITDESGAFAIPIEEFGAGALEYEVEVLARLSEFRATHSLLPMPGSNKRLLIIMSPGRDTHRDNDILGETMRIKQQLESR